MFLPEMIGESAAIAAVRAQGEALVRRRAEGGEHGPILIFGETGTGKRLLGQGLHRVTRWSQGPHVVVRCWSTPTTR
jgi:DNA-binding NtrC family response regulator